MTKRVVFGRSDADRLAIRLVALPSASLAALVYRVALAVPSLGVHAQASQTGGARS